MNYRKITYFFLILITISTLIGITFLNVDDFAGFGFLGAIATGYFIEKKWKKTNKK